MRRFLLLSAAAIAGAVPMAANAALIAGDSYVIGTGAYTSSTSLASQYASAPVAGFTSAGGGNSTAQFATQTVGLVNAFDNSTATDSGKIGYLNPNTTTLLRNTARNLSSVPNSSVYYESILINQGSFSGTAPTAARSLLAGIGNSVTPTAAGTTAAGLTGLYFGLAQDGVTASTGNLVIRYNSNSNTVADQVVINGNSTPFLGATELLVAEIDVAANGPLNDQVIWWLNPTDPTSDATLTATAAATGTFSGEIVTNDATPGSSFARLNYLSQGWGNSSAASAYFDEPRLSTDLAGLAPVPEPTSLALIALGASTLLGRRRRA